MSFWSDDALKTAVEGWLHDSPRPHPHPQPLPPPPPPPPQTHTLSQFLSERMLGLSQTGLHTEYNDMFPIPESCLFFFNA